MPVPAVPVAQRRSSYQTAVAAIRGKDPQRAFGMAFGAAQSISFRNAIKAEVPGVLWKKAVERAKQVAANRLSDDTPARSIQKAVDLFKGMGVTLAQIEKALAKAKRRVWQRGDHPAPGLLQGHQRRHGHQGKPVPAGGNAPVRSAPGSGRPGGNGKGPVLRRQD